MFKRFSIVISLVAFFLLGTAQQSLPFYIGTYTSNGSYGIYVAQFNTSTGAITITDSIAADNPSYLALNKAGNKIYAVTENGGNKLGGVSSFVKNEKTNTWELLNKESIPSGGDHPCYISLNRRENFLAVANYSGGSLAILPLNAQGVVGNAVQVIQHTGRSVNEARQTSPHVHTAMFAPKQKFVVVADLGTDMVKAYVFNAKSTLPIDTSKEISIKLPGGAGPRHIAFHPKKPVFYVMSELNGMVSVHAFTKRNISILQRVKADSISKQPGSADIHVSADGKFLYASNRAEANNISVFSISAFDGRLTGVGQQSTLGKTPRNFCLDPTGKFLLAANQNSNNIVVFRIDPLTGMPVPTGQTLSIPSPVCIVFGSK